MTMCWGAQKALKSPLTSDPCDEMGGNRCVEAGTVTTSLWPPALVCSFFFQTAQTPNSIFFPLFCPKQDIFLPQESPLSKLFPCALFCKIQIQITFSQFPTFWMAHVLLSCLLLSLSRRFWPWGPGQAKSRGGRESTGSNRESQRRELMVLIPHVREGAGGAAPRPRILGAKCSRFFCHFLSKLCLLSCCEGFFWGNRDGVWVGHPSGCPGPGPGRVQRC